MAIDLALTKGQSASSVAREYGIKIDSLLRHRANHLGKFTEAESLSSMLRQTIQELDAVALEALSRQDHRAAIDARRQKANALTTLLEAEREQQKRTQDTGEGTNLTSLSQLDAIVEKVMAHRDRCPVCGWHTLPKATGNSTGKVQ